MATVAEQLRRADSLTPVSESARLDTELLLCHTLQCNRTYLYTWPEKDLTPAQIAQFDALLQRRQSGEPIAYILGQQEFWSLPLAVSPATLIPRADTETLVEWVLSLPLNGSHQLLDLGTGTGAIALALAQERPQWQLTGVDISDRAVALARANATSLKISNCEFIEGNWFNPVQGRKFTVIVSNPPYIDPKDPHLHQGDVRFEPHSALIADDQGLADLRFIAERARTHLLPSGWLCMEHGYDQAQIVQQILTDLGYCAVGSERDLGGQLRVTFGQWRQGASHDG
ncbi:peptide chain release factor N(5)-glutamine methyltransferase [Simiduia aestuariiviva]|uniref:Release factor glutamine methyltransferase n=1 Tax=Simiduia aestuariiviva TaxID=1510459 RepID=A0A839UVP8_9GAMM|nr:peptide chain release factor N(5)-glutamine methyltransferase [Simiduia aestuariiviva]MBB3170136.1 release factor glutamine methyltransferase [Simiduia aestuariiviva]